LFDFFANIKKIKYYAIQGTDFVYLENITALGQILVISILRNKLNVIINFI